MLEEKNKELKNATEIYLSFLNWKPLKRMRKTLEM